MDCKATHRMQRQPKEKRRLVVRKESSCKGAITSLQMKKRMTSSNK
jgi:hypothetical protein